MTSDAWHTRSFELVLPLNVVAGGLLAFSSVAATAAAAAAAQCHAEVKFNTTSDASMSRIQCH
jgi:hypothetical protein